MITKRVVVEERPAYAQTIFGWVVILIGIFVILSVLWVWIALALIIFLLVSRGGLYALWTYRLEVATLTALAAAFAYVSVNATVPLGICATALLVTVASLIGPVRRLYRNQIIRRHFTRSLIAAGGAEPAGKNSRKDDPLVGARPLRVFENKAGYAIEVKGHIDALYKAEPVLAGKLDRRPFFPVLTGGVRVRPGRTADRAQVVIYSRDLLAADRPPIPSVLLNATETSIWEPHEHGMFEDGSPNILQPVAGHVLMAGMTRSGKSTAMHDLLLWNALDRHNHVLLMDNKGTELNAWKPIADAFVKDDMAEAIRVLQKLRHTMNERNAVLADGGARKVKRGDATYALFIDELAFYVDNNEEPEQAVIFTRLLRDLAQRGASAGIHIFAAMQRPAANLLDSNTRAQLAGTAFCFRVHEQSTARMVFGRSGIPAEEISEDTPGVGYTGTDSTHARRFRAPNLTEEQVEEQVAKAAALRLTAEASEFLAGQPEAKPEAKQPPPAWKLRENEIREELLKALPETYDLKHLYTMDRLVRELKRPRREIDAVLSKLVKEQLVSRKTDDGGKARAKHPYGYFRVRRQVAQSVRSSEDPDPTEL